MTAKPLPVLAALLAWWHPSPIVTQPARSDTTEMASIAAGEFWMGRSQNWLLDELGMHLRARLDDQPVHLVFLDAYRIDKYEVTNRDYARFVAATGRRAPFHWAGGKVPEGQEMFPVYNVTWDDAVAYCRSVGKRLPTEAEWERAARGGVEKSMFPWGARLAPEAKSAADTDAKRARYGMPDGPTVVGSFAPNGFGLYDVTGNVWEWVSDWYEQGYYAISPERNPQGPESGMYRVIRGGGWSDGDERILALHYRNFTNASLPSNTVGFRCALPD